MHHGFLQQIHRRSTRNSTTSGLRWRPIFPEKGTRHPHLFYLEMSEVPDEEVPIYSSTVLLNTADQTLTSGEKPHTHEPGNLVAEKADFRHSLKRKAADQHLSATQNLLTEALANCNSELNVELPKTQSLA